MVIKTIKGRKDRAKSLPRVLDKAVADNGVVFGRTQELLYELEQIVGRAKYNKLADIEVIVDSPMAAKFTKHKGLSGEIFKNMLPVVVVCL
ncbi:hypothetical protein [Psychromonas hadalis]|uniref:hypothetical protein n=1 Tax=Psychromonas hadalis TaxID=211669 RepID=UPI0003B594E5